MHWPPFISSACAAISFLTIQRRRRCTARTFCASVLPALVHPYCHECWAAVRIWTATSLIFYCVAFPVLVLFLYFRYTFLFSLNSRFSCIVSPSCCLLLLVPKSLLIFYILQKKGGLAVDGAPNVTSDAIWLDMSLKDFRRSRLQLVVESKRGMEICWGRRSERWSRSKKKRNKYIYIYIHSNEIHNVASLIVYWCLGVSSTCFGP